jgi:hypothetical protein
MRISDRSCQPMEKTAKKFYRGLLTLASTSTPRLLSSRRRVQSRS